MDKNEFIRNFRNAFGNYELPIAIWYSEEAVAQEEKTRGCFIKYLKPAREGNIVSLSSETISCPGAKVYCGFTAPPPFIPSFVSEKERYKKTPEMVTDFIKDLNMPDKSKQFINFASIDRIENFENIVALIFFATPDVLAGLVSWALFDTNEPDAVSVPFGSGCSSIVSQTVVENQKKGNRVFLGLFDPSVRPQVEPNILSFGVPMSRFKKMYYTFSESCLNGRHAWNKVKERIENNGL
jgi:hypothetical protein